MQKVDRPGVFRAEIVEVGLLEVDSGAVAITVRARLLEHWREGAWLPWAEYDMEAEGNLWIVKKDGGGVNSKAVESVMRATGWDGDVESITNGRFQPTHCQVVINEKEYKGELQRKISFVNDYDRQPGAVGNVTPEKAKALAGKHGAALRAIASTVNRNRTAPPTDKPAAPPKPAGVPAGQLARANKELQETTGGNDIPF